MAMTIDSEWQTVLRTRERANSMDITTGAATTESIRLYEGDGDDNSENKSDNNIVGSELSLFHGNNAPTLCDPCLMKTLRTRRGGVDVVRTYREESSRSDVLAVDWTEDIKLTSAISAKRITVS